MKKSIIALAISPIMLAGCSETLGALVAGAGAVSAFMASGSANPDYTKYADICKAIVSDIRDIRVARYGAIETGLNSTNQTIAGGTLVMLALESRDDAVMFSKCQLQGPKSFLQTIFENTNVAQIILALYQENRADSRAQRQMQIAKELGTLRINADLEAARINNQLLTDLAGRPSENFKAGADAATPAGE